MAAHAFLPPSIDERLQACFRPSSTPTPEFAPEHLLQKDRIDKLTDLGLVSIQSIYFMRSAYSIKAPTLSE